MRINNERINLWFARFGENVVLKYRFLFLAMVLAFLIFGAIGTQRIYFDSSNESFLPEGDSAVLQNDRFKEIFGNEDFVFIYIEADDVFSHQVLSYIRRVSEDLEAHLPFVKEVTSLGNVDFIDAQGDTLVVEDLIGDKIPESAEELLRVKRKTLAKKTYVGRLVSEDATNTGVVITFKRIPDHAYIAYEGEFSPLDQVEWPADKVIMKKDIYLENEISAHKDKSLTKVSDPRKLIVPALNVILERHSHSGFKVITTGVPVIDFEGEVMISSEGGKFGLLSLLASILLLFVTFRNLRAVIAPVMVLFFTIIILYGLMGWLRIPLSITSMMISPLILVISVSYAIHVINHFQHQFRLTGERRESVVYAFEHSTWPCFLTALTTAMGFVSFLIVPVKPLRQVGVVCAMGVFITYILVMIIIPIIFSFGKDKKLDRSEADIRLKGGAKQTVYWTAKWADFVVSHARKVAAASIIVVVLVVAFSFNTRVDIDALNMMGDRLEYVKNARYIGERLGGNYSFEVFVELPRPGMAKDPAVLNAMDVLAKDIEKWDSVKMVSSITDVIKDLNMTMNGNQEAFYKIPASQNLVAQYLLLYEMSGGESLEDVVDFDFRYLHLSVLVKGFSQEFEKNLFHVETAARTLFPTGTKITVVGDVPILLRMIHLLAIGQIKSIFVAFLVITLIMMLILQSFRMGLISMIPNIMPVVVISGVMGMFGFPIDMLTILIAPMIIGMAVDATVHYMIHFRQEFDKHGTYRVANRETFVKVGRAILFASVILAVGFSVMGFSIVASMVHMAILSATGMLAALVADLFVTPILFVFIRPFKERQPVERKQEEAN